MTILQFFHYVEAPEYVNILLANLVNTGCSGNIARIECQQKFSEL